MDHKKSEPRVVISRNGPYIVGGRRRRFGGLERERTFPPAEKYALCRCGQSKKKPFCDGTHAKIGFDGSETANRAPYVDQATGFDGPELMLTDVESLCAFARFCDPNGKVWAQVAGTDVPQVRAMFLRQVNDCPSGRLVAWDKATRQPVERKLPVSIGLIEDPREDCSGPIWLRDAQPGYAVPLRSIAKQAILRRRACLDQISFLIIVSPHRPSIRAPAARQAPRRLRRKRIGRVGGRARNR